MDAEREKSITPTYRNYVLGVLVVSYIFNFLDRQILTILLEPIKKELALSDLQLGLLTGFAFAFFYTFLGIPIAMWADRGVRRDILALALFIWSGMTAVTGWATSYLGLLLARIGVGIGEAGGSPPSHSLISDYFPPERRGMALGIYSWGIPIGAATGTLAGAWIGDAFGWRMAFLVVGLPGVLLALIVRLTVREPPRGAFDGHLPERRAESFGEVFGFLWKLRSFRHMSLAAALHAFYGYGSAAFLPSFFARVHDVPLRDRGTYIALIILSGTIGTFVGGWLSDKRGATDERWYMWVPGLSTLAGAPLAAVFYLWPDFSMVTLLLGTAPVILGQMYLGPTFAMTQTLVRPRMRALAAAILLFVINLIGLGGGPSFVGWLSDALRPAHGNQALRYALLVTVVAGALWSTVHYALAARTLREDLRAKNA